LRSIPSQKN